MLSRGPRGHPGTLLASCAEGCTAALMAADVYATAGARRLGSLLTRLRMSTALPVDGPVCPWNRWRMRRYRTPAELARSVAQIPQKAAGRRSGRAQRLAVARGPMLRRAGYYPKSRS